MNDISTDSPKTPVVAQRKIIYRNPDGTTKVVVQNVVSSQATKPTVDATTNVAPSQPIRQKLGIIRMDGKITSVTGLQPGQQLIESPQGLRIVTTSTPNRTDRKVIVKSELPKMVSKVSSTSQDNSDATTIKTPIVVRQQTRGSPANVIVKSVPNKTVQQTTPQRVILNSGHSIVATTPQQVITSKRQISANASTQKIVRAANIQQLLNNQGTQKFVINQANTQNKYIIASSANNQVVNQNATATSQQTIVQNSTTQQQVDFKIFIILSGFLFFNSLS